MSEIFTVGLDLARCMFQLNGADAARRGALQEADARSGSGALRDIITLCRCHERLWGGHFWGREIGKLGHEVRMSPWAYVKPFAKRQKSDAADADAICEAVQRLPMRFVPVKSEETQGTAMVFRIREVLIRQRTQAINAPRGGRVANVVEIPWRFTPGM